VLGVTIITLLKKLWPAFFFFGEIIASTSVSENAIVHCSTVIVG